jgi:hypothetical protein
MNEPIKDKAPKPPGLLPKNVQSWVIVGVALLMIVIMWLTGGKKPQAAAKSSTSSLQPPAPVEVNETKIAELQNRIQELQKQQLAAQSALAQQTRLLDSARADQVQSQPGTESSTEGCETSSGEHAGFGPPASGSEKGWRRSSPTHFWLPHIPQNAGFCFGKDEGRRKNCAGDSSAPEFENDA